MPVRAQRTHEERHGGSSKNFPIRDLARHKNGLKNFALDIKVTVNPLTSYDDRPWLRNDIFCWRIRHKSGWESFLTGIHRIWKMLSFHIMNVGSKKCLSQSGTLHLKTCRLPRHLCNIEYVPTFLLVNNHHGSFHPRVENRLFLLSHLVVLNWSHQQNNNYLQMSWEGRAILQSRL